MRYLTPAIVVGLVYTSTIYQESVSNYFFDPFKKGYWYLFVLTFFNLLLLPFNLHKSCGKLSKDLFIDFCISACIYIPIVLVHKLANPNIDGLFSSWHLTYFWPVFFLGFIVRRYSLIEYIAGHNWGFSFSLIGYAFMIAVKWSHPYMNIITGIFASFTLFFIFKNREHKSTVIEKELARIGKNSLDIYIFHFFFLHAFNLTFLGDWFVETNNYFLEFVTILLISTSIAYISMLVGYIIKISNVLRLLIYGEFQKAA